MTLFERLKPQYLPALQREQLKFPNITQSIIDHLESIEYVHYLTYGCWVDLKFITKVDNPYELFDEL